MTKKTWGVKTYSDLLGRCRIDDLTGCAVYPTAKRHASPLWLNGQTCSIAKAMRLLVLGEPPAGKVWAPMACLNRMCCTRAHWSLTTAGEYRSALKPTLPADELAKLKASARRRLGKVDEALAREIRAREGSIDKLAAEFGLSRSTIAKVRNARTGPLPGASAFTWRP